MENLAIYEKARSVPENAKKKISGGRLNGKTDINPMWRIKMLTELFGPCGIGWYYKTVRQWIEMYGEEAAAFVNIELYFRKDGEWSQPVPGTGGSMFAARERGGIYVSDECFKMAATDAISVACKQLGIGADVYWEADSTKYSAVGGNEGSITRKGQKEPQQLQEVIRELSRTGYTETSVCRTYKINSLSEMSELQVRDFLKKIKNVPDREAG